MKYQFLVTTNATDSPPGHGAALRRRLEREVHYAISRDATVVEYAEPEPEPEPPVEGIDTTDWVSFGFACAAIGCIIGLVVAAAAS